MHSPERCLPGHIDRAVHERDEVEVADPGDVIAHRQRSRHKQITDPPERRQPAAELLDDRGRGRHDLQSRSLSPVDFDHTNRPSEHGSWPPLVGFASVVTDSLTRPMVLHTRNRPPQRPELAGVVERLFRASRSRMTSPIEGTSPCRRRMTSATIPVHPVWCAAPRPAALSPWKYSLKVRLSFQFASCWSRSTPPKQGRRPSGPGRKIDTSR